ncbi:DEAD/DEAH box helicase [Nocardioides limicola]|uniref:DEAD/DEAH box helicase n=1 Tax=Nocardioides limicola TaxID=2803368 RepID=UPI00193BDBE8|nr:helicase C-terminal domain-containing protein [Nocardioides sp. DJM-14]
MAINFGALNQSRAADALIDPRDIFNALPAKPPGMNFLRGPQDQVLEKWFARRNQRDVVVKLNTGGGKTVVGLLIAKSSLAEGKGPVAYLVPDKYLVDQVIAEAGRLGIPVANDPKVFAYSQGSAILVDTFQKLFNGRSVFGVGGSAGRSPSARRPHTVIIDDAHACLNKAEQAFRLTIPSSHDVYDKLLALFAPALEDQSPAGFVALEAKSSSGDQQVPYWSWADKQRDVLTALQPLAAEDDFQFSWPLIADSLPISRAVFTSDALEIEAPCLPSDIVTGFGQAERRIYLTATLADDGILVSHLGAEPAAVSDPITPASAGDIGDRLILVPQQTHPTAADDEIRDLIVGLATTRNVVVIVPSLRRAAYWQPYAKFVLDKDTLTWGIDQLRQHPRLGLVVLLNRYDGVDLPGDACHVLVVDGLPEAMSGTERIDQAQLTGSELLVARQVQRLEQGMGRATRSNDDHCVVFLLGNRLAERLHGTGARDCFSPATRAQLELSEQVAAQLQGTGLDALQAAALQCLNRDPDWLAISRATLAPLRYDQANVSELSVASREAFEHAVAGDFTDALAAMQEAVDAADGPAEKGYVLQQYAAYEHHLNPARAQQTQKSANRKNRSVLRPMDGVEYEKLSAPTLEQGAAASASLQRLYASGNDLLLGINALLSDLSWGVRAEAFEQAWHDLADHLGFAGQRPERDTGRGPDNLWALTNGSFHVIEAKNEVKASHPVYKKHAEQLSNAMDWFRQTYGTKTIATPVMVHARAMFDKKAAVPTGCRVVTKEKLEALRDAIHAYATALADADTFRDAAGLGRLLASLGLTATDFTDRFTAPALRDT